MTNNTNKRFDRNNHGRSKVKAVNLTKEFGNFEEAYSEVIKLVPEVKAYGGEEIMHDAVVGFMLNMVKNNIPSTTNTNYPYTLSFSIDAHEVGLKTDNTMAFGWREIFDRNAGKTIYKFRVTFLSVSAYRKSIIEDMKASGWGIIENQVQSRFWNAVEDNRRPKSTTHKEQDNTVEKVSFEEKVEVTEDTSMKEAFEKAEKEKTAE